MKIVKKHTFTGGEVGFEIDRWPNNETMIEFHSWRILNGIESYVRLGTMIIEYKNDISKEVPLIVVESTNPEPLCTLCVLRWG